jgi:hypothetical protein
MTHLGMDRSDHTDSCAETGELWAEPGQLILKKENKNIWQFDQLIFSVSHNTNSVRNDLNKLAAAGTKTTVKKVLFYVLF